MRELTRTFAGSATYAAILVVLSVLWIWALAHAIEVTRRWEFDDVHAYVAAAQRVAAGEPLYVSASDPSDLYLYAPWFAIAWIPFSGLSTSVIEVAWMLVLFVAFFACLWSFWRSWAALALGLLLGSLLYRTVGWGNVQPVVLAALIYLLPTRAGPWMVGVAASLKPWPILAVAVYAWQRQWRYAAIAGGTAFLLWLPIFAFNWTDYPAGSRPPNIYDITFLLAVPALIRSVRAARVGQGPQAAAQSGSPAGEGG